MKKLLCSWLLLCLAGCSHAVTINTYPGANVRLDGRDLGESPATFVDHAGLGRAYDLQISRSGYEPRAFTLRQEWDSTCAVISILGGLVALVPFVGLLFCARLPQSSYDFELRPAAAGVPGAPSRAVPSGRSPPSAPQESQPSPELVPL